MAGGRSIISDDEGISLVELIVAVIVSSLIAGLLTMVFINGWTTQQKSIARDSATGQANVLTSTMANALRNATSIRVSGAGTRIDAVVTKPSASFSGTWTWECRAWVLTDQSIRYSAGATPRGADPSGWTVLVGKSAKRPLDKVAAPSGGVPFTLVGSKGVHTTLDITVGDVQKTVKLSDGMTAQAVATTGAIACW
ncbi:type II secretion system protein J [uncultured Microbacterium sp.]|uniref:Prepilin-type N-terminal cleavage/methylation domain-containing protein n=1 Tax=uncultured Microbacterium sp. TaxID=191216 RepID=A0A1Y5P9E4_9MICO|nr:hypothetical protein [uncultured Microbacterium sp.]SBS74120.1 hypothetical protein MIPYR_50200 [uncultured Microbacterium sp.]